MRNCVTHHFACDCREEKFKALEKELLEVSTDRDGWKHNCDDMDELIHSLQKDLEEVRADRDNWQEIAGRGCLIKAGFEIYEETEKLKKELEEVKIKNIQLHSRIKVLQIELAHKNAADSKINFKGGE